MEYYVFFRIVKDEALPQLWNRASLRANKYLQNKYSFIEIWRIFQFISTQFYVLLEQFRDNMIVHPDYFPE